MSLGTHLHHRSAVAAAAVLALASPGLAASVGGVERAAYCMARTLGASWFTYTSCDNAAWRAQAARLLSGRPL